MEVAHIGSAKYDATGTNPTLHKVAMKDEKTNENKEKETKKWSDVQVI